MTRQMTVLVLLPAVLAAGTWCAADEVVYQRVAQAEPDECYNGFGQPYVPFDECDGRGVPKRNQAYPWGMTRRGDRIWIGTAANIGQLAKGLLGFPFPVETDEAVVESWFSQYPGVPVALRVLLGDWRPPKVDLLYGESRLPRYTPVLPGIGLWKLVDNRMGGARPLFGSSGFGTHATIYTWSMAVFGGELFVGLNELPILPGAVRGADLWRFPDPDGPAVLVDNAGLTTPLNEGVRGMVVGPDGLYLGMTNGANLSPEGGWQLIRLNFSGGH